MHVLADEPVTKCFMRTLAFNDTILLSDNYYVSCNFLNSFYEWICLSNGQRGAQVLKYIQSIQVN